MQTRNLLEVRNLKTHFFTDDGVVKAVDGVDFDIPKGKTLCLVGESGCGKSITARSLLQLVDYPGRIVEGSIFLKTNKDTVDIAKLPPRGQEIRKLRGREIAMVFQEPMSALSPVHTVGNQIIESIRLHLPLSKAEARASAIDLLDKVGIPSAHKRIDSYTFELSGGMRQRAMIAMALACKPKLLIADEPTTALDVTTQANTLDLLRDLQVELGMSILFITHDLGVVADIADEVAVMYLGQIVEQADVHSLFQAPQHPYTQALLRSIPRLETRNVARLEAIEGFVPPPKERPSGCLFHTRCDHAVAGKCDRIMPELIAVNQQQDVRCLLYTDADLDLPVSLTPSNKSQAIQSSENAKSLLNIVNLKKHFPIKKGFFQRTVGTVKAVNDVSFDIFEGETLGLVGESGCGKTTLGQCIVRLHAASSGQINYLADQSSKDLTQMNERALRPYRQDIRMIFQDPYASLNPRMPVLELVSESLQVSGCMKGKKLEQHVTKLLEKVGLHADYLHRYVHAFSGGQRQRIGIARALAPNPKLVVADEAVSALDVSVQAQILNLLKDLQEEFKLTYLFISHDLSVIAHMSDRVAVMYVGNIVELASAEEIFTNPKHPYTEALLSAVLEPDPSQRNQAKRIRLESDVADPANPPSGCPFHPRCRYAESRCKTKIPTLERKIEDHLVACHFADSLKLSGVKNTIKSSNAND